MRKITLIAVMALLTLQACAQIKLRAIEKAPDSIMIILSGQEGQLYFEYLDSITADWQSQQLSVHWDSIFAIPLGFVDGIDHVNDGDTSSTNEIETWMTLSGIPANIDIDATDDFSGSWNDLTDIPLGFADNIDNTGGGGGVDSTPYWDNIQQIPAGFADNVDNVYDGDSSATNELQNVLSDVNLSENSGVVTLDFDGTDNQISTIDIFGGIGISMIVPGPGAISIENLMTWNNLPLIPTGFADDIDNVYDGDSSATNELQNWGNLPGIPAGFADNVDNVNDADADPTNELQNWGNLPGIPADIDTDTGDDFDRFDEAGYSWGVDVTAVDADNNTIDNFELGEGHGIEITRSSGRTIFSVDTTAAGIGGNGADSDWTTSGNDMYSAVSGNVGIGTSSPARKLHLYETTNIATRLLIENTSTGSSAQSSFALNSGGNEWVHYTRNSTGDKYHVYSTTLADDILTLTSSGRVGISETSPNRKFEIKTTGGSTESLGLTNAFDEVLFFFEDNSDNSKFNINYSTSGDDDISIFQNGDVAFPNRFVGIRNLAPTQALDVNGKIRMRTGAASGKKIGGDANGVMSWVDDNSFDNIQNLTKITSGNFDYDYLQFQHGATAKASIGIRGKGGISVARVDGSPFTDHIFEIDGSGLSGGVWSENGSDIYFDTGKVAIGHDSPTHQLHIKRDGLQTEGGILIEDGGSSSRIWHNGKCNIDGHSGVNLTSTFHSTQIRLDDEAVITTTLDLEGDLKGIRTMSKLSADFVKNNSTTFSTISDLDLEVGNLHNSEEVYEFTAFIMFNSPAAADIKLKLICHIDTDIKYTISGSNDLHSDGDEVTITTTGSDQGVTIRGRVDEEFFSFGSKIQFQVAQETAQASDTKVLQDSYARIMYFEPE